MRIEDNSRDFQIVTEDPNQPDILRLLYAGEEFGASLYPAESNHFLSLNELLAPNVLFYVARDSKYGRPLGTGALVLNGDWAEIKRMWVEPETRRRGIASAILSVMENAAKNTGIKILRLETGIYNRSALVLYERFGFIQREPFGEYGPDPLSVFMEKSLMND